MAKIDKSKYTKEEWKKIKLQRRASKEQERALNELTKISEEIQPLDQPDFNPLIKQQRTILCLKHGSKYPAMFVNNLYNMCKRHSKIEWDFVCLTEDTTNINPEIKTLPLPDNLFGWWCKPYIYSSELPIQGTILYMDLDVVIANNFDHLWTFAPNSWCAIRDFTRSMQPQWEKYNSSVLRFEKGQLNHVWKDFIKDPNHIISGHFGDQDWLWTRAGKTATYWPDRWIQSYKWEIRKDKQLLPGTKGTRKFTKQEDDTIPPKDCCIAVFHGDPNPNMVDDKWVVDNWR